MIYFTNAVLFTLLMLVCVLTKRRGFTVSNNAKSSIAKNNYENTLHHQLHNPESVNRNNAGNSDSDSDDDNNAERVAGESEILSIEEEMLLALENYELKITESIERDKMTTDRKLGDLGIGEADDNGGITLGVVDENEEEEDYGDVVDALVAYDETDDGSVI